MESRGPPCRLATAWLSPERRFAATQTSAEFWRTGRYGSAMPPHAKILFLELPNKLASLGKSIVSSVAFGYSETILKNLGIFRPPL